MISNYMDCSDDLDYGKCAAKLSRKHQIHSRKQYERKHLAARIERTNPTSFQYKPLDRSKGAVRLIKLFPLTEEYIAVSYVWGNSSSSKPVSINGELFHVRPNLYDFLHHAATTRMESLFWVDAICINQSDLEEKNSHVRHMGTIFANATKVIAWLGHKSQSPSTAMRRDPPREWLCCDRKEDAGHDTARHRHCDWKVPSAWSWELVRHEYWSRLWIAQELGLAKRVDILWKKRFYDWSRLKNHLNFHMHRRGTLRGQSDPRSKAFVKNLNYIAKLPVARYLKFVGFGPLGNLVPQFANHECQIGHDHVFGLLSLARDGSAFEPDYRESNISLLFRLMNFCYDNPIAAFTRKLGVALELDPQIKGIPVTVVGRPHFDVASDKVQHIRYHFPDATDFDTHEGDLLVRIPDTYLNFLFRPSAATEDGISIFALVARVSLTSALVEKAAKQFGATRPTTQWNRDQNLILEQAVEHIHRATLRIHHHSTDEPRLFCNWQTILAIFEASKTDAAQGRLESRIRQWIAKPPNLTMDPPRLFTVR